MMFEQKSIIDELKVSLTGTPIDAKNPEIPMVAIETNAHEDITARSKVSKINQFRDEMEIDIEED